MDTSRACSASLVVKSFTLAVMIKSFTLAVMVGFVCLTVRSTPYRQSLHAHTRTRSRSLEYRRQDHPGRHSHHIVHTQGNSSHAWTSRSCQETIFSSAVDGKRTRKLVTERECTNIPCDRKCPHKRHHHQPREGGLLSPISVPRRPYCSRSRAVEAFVEISDAIDDSGSSPSNSASPGTTTSVPIWVAKRIHGLTCFGDVPSPCQTTGESSHSCLVGLPVFPLVHLGNAHAVVMVLSLSGFSDIFSIIWSNSSLMVIRGKHS